MIKINPEVCNSCGACVGVCPVNALTLDYGILKVDKDKCINCGACEKMCPVGAISLEEGEKKQECPKCGSTNFTLWAGGTAGMIYQCKDCGYHGPLELEEDFEISEEMKKDLEEAKRDSEGGDE